MRGPRAPLLFVFLSPMVTTPCPLHAQRPTANKPPADTVAGPSHEMTKAWLESEMPALAKQFLVEKRDQVLTYPARTIRWTYLKTAGVSDVVLDSCTLKYTSTLRSEPYLDNQRQSPFLASSSYEVPLSNVDINDVVVQEVPTFQDSRFENPGFQVRVGALPSRGPVFRSANSSGVSFVHVPARDKDAAERIARAIKHAAALCGARTSPF